MVGVFRLFILTVTLAAAGAGGSLKVADAPVAISVRAVVEDDTLHIRGSATVPDGAWIIYAAYRLEEPQRRVTGYAQVEDEQFAAQIAASRWPAGKISVDAHFQVMLPARKQPDSVIDRFGPNGERMTGKDVVEGGGSFRAAIASTSVVKP